MKVIRAPQKGLLLGFGFLFSKAAVAGFCGKRAFVIFLATQNLKGRGCVSQV